MFYVTVTLATLVVVCIQILIKFIKGYYVGYDNENKNNNLNKNKSLNQ